MAKSARNLVFEGMELLPAALIPYVEAKLKSAFQADWQDELSNRYRGLNIAAGDIKWDNQALLKIMDMFWNDVFKTALGRSERALVNELVEVRNKIAHEGSFSYDDAERALDSMARLMKAISASEVAEQLDASRYTLLQTKFRELRRTEERKGDRKDVDVETIAGLKPWRDVATPHDDVMSGNFNQAEFAADLAKVHNGSAADEYKDAKAFYARTYLTEGLTGLLQNSAKRLADKGGDPVVELQTNFGGGKTHSLLALYHMVGATKVQDLLGLDQLLLADNITLDEDINRAVLVGTSHGPNDAKITDDGTVIHTSWGDIAWQLGGKTGYEMVQTQDESGIAPGSEILEKLFNRFSPSLILIDEWVAYLRQIYKNDGLPSGSFDANLSFVQSLTEAVKASPKTLLVATLPASDIEVGGDGGQEALARLKQTFNRLESSWQPASQEESYEIVRRRLFKEITNEAAHRDNAVKQFMKIYRDTPNAFPQKANSPDYEDKLQKSYPIHPELFDQLYETWSAIDRFQKTRGILRLMAQVVHELWQSDDTSIMIMPGSVPIKSQFIQPELTKYLEQGVWQAIIAHDVDGDQSIPASIDKAEPNLGRIFATKRIARALFLGTAPMPATKISGLDDKQINLGVMMPTPKDNLNIFGDALRKLPPQSTHLHSDGGGQYWYSTAPSLSHLAADKARKIDEATILNKIDEQLKAYIKNQDREKFDSVHAVPVRSDVPDEADGVRVVVFGITHPHSSNGNAGSLAMDEAKQMVDYRGSAPRVYKNTLIFLAADDKKIENLKTALRNKLGWENIVNNIEKLDLTQSDAAQARNMQKQEGTTFNTRLKEAWCWMIYPEQPDATDTIKYITKKLSSQDGLFNVMKRQLETNNVLYNELGQCNLNMVLNKYIWHDNQHLKISTLLKYHAQFIYMPRLINATVFAKTILSAISGKQAGEFAYAEGYIEEEKKYVGLVVENGANTPITLSGESIIVHPLVAQREYPQPNNPLQADTPQNVGMPTATISPDDTSDSAPLNQPKLPRRFRATTTLSSLQPATDLAQIRAHILTYIEKIEGANITLRLEIDVSTSAGVDKNTARTIVENAHSLGLLDIELE